jgi:plastocyanin
MSDHLSITRARQHAVLALIGLLVAGLSACGSGEAENAGASPAPSTPAQSSSAESFPSGGQTPAEQFVITIKDFSYTVPESVPAGATVTVVNEDTEAHTVTAKDEFDVTVGPGATGEFTAPQDMDRHDFVCLFHGNMKDTLVTS